MIKNDKNSAFLIGKVQKKQKSYNFFEKTIKKYEISCKRTSNYCDILELQTTEDLKKGDIVYVAGSLRSRRDHKKIVLYVMAYDVKHVSDANCNSLEISGTIVTVPVKHITPSGRVVTETILAVNRNYYKSSYIPIIAFGHKAEKLEQLNIGQKVLLKGRIQSRDYIKNGRIQRANEICITDNISLN